MQVIKEPDQGLLLNFFSAERRNRLAVAHLSFFDLSDPDRILSEQDLWPLVQAELGGTVFDMGLPKPLGEVLVRGKCFAPQGRPVRALKTGLKIGPISKEVYVFGFRQWAEGGIGGPRISEPLPFSTMDLGYENAFGGRDFPLNPAGMGLARVQLPTGETGHPLPHLEDPDRLIAPPDDRPDPAGFGPLDVSWPQRAEKLGTYDQAWRREDWPFFPRDVDWRFANAAPADQWLSESYNHGFFQGDEAITMRHLHPEHQEYHSRLPVLRPRCFVEQVADLEHPEGKTLFKEVSLRLETVWLFPHLERGVLIHRGAADVADDEGLDVAHLLLVKEDPSEYPRDIEHYQRLLQERMERGAPLDTAPLEEADALLAQARARLDELPGIVEEALDRIQGKAPIPRDTPEETATQALETIASMRASLDGYGEQLEQTRAAFGHALKINPAILDQYRGALDNLEKEVNDSMATLDKSRRRIADQQNQGRARAEEHMAGLPPRFQDGKAEILEAMTVSDHIPPAKERWQTQAMRFLQFCRKSLWDYPEGPDLSRWVGLSDQTIRRSWIGYNPSNLEVSRFEWGLTESPDDDSTMVLPQGMTTPYFNDAELCHLRIRPPVTGFQWISGEVEGSGERLMFLAPRPGRPLLVLNFCAEAWLAKQFIGHLCGVIVMARPDMNLKPEQKELLAKAPQLLIADYPENRVIYESCPLEAWQQLNSNAEIFKIPRRATSLIEARRMGLDLETWVRGLIKPELLPDGTPRDIHDRMPPLDLDATGIIAKGKKEIEALFQSKTAAMDALVAGKAADVQKAFREAGLQPPTVEDLFPNTRPDAASSMFASDPGRPIEAARKKLDACLDDMRNQLRQKEQVPPEVEEQISEFERSMREGLDQAAEQYEQGMSQLRELEAGRPQWARDLMIGAGLDPDDPEPMKQLTREDVERCRNEGAGLAGRNLAGLDLSGMDLSGLDFKGAHMQKTILKGSNLAGSDLGGALAEDADFSEANLEDARLTGAILSRARFTETRLTRTNFSKTMLKETDFSKADLRGACLEGACFEQAVCPEAVFSGASASQAAFIRTRFENSDFQGADLSRASFLDCALDESDFKESDLTSANFISTTGNRADFTGANLTNARFLQGSSFQDADFNQATADRMFGQRTDLSGCHFKGAGMNRALIEGCNLSGADLTGAVAREARFNKSDLTLARLTGIDMMHGSLRKARLGHADLSAASFFGAEFYRTQVAETLARGTDFKQTKLEGFEQQVFHKEKDGRHEPK
ncbi:MAG: DUF2169 domain-containing protein [Proteobacteria bacterium]|nr:DUF2169 domain-containing protein [Pseudomonadota bacterium]